MTPKQKKVSLNAAVLRSITGCKCLLSQARITLLENYSKELKTLPETEQQMLAKILNDLDLTADRLRTLEKPFRLFAKFNLKSKWERRIDKLITQEELEKSNDS